MIFESSSTSSSLLSSSLTTISFSFPSSSPLSSSPPSVSSRDSESDFSLVYLLRQTTFCHFFFHFDVHVFYHV